MIDKIRASKQYAQWRKRVLIREGFVCSVCFSDTCLEVHHKKELIEIMREQGITTFEEAMSNKFMWDLDNGITVCSYCHKVIHYGL